MSLDETFTDQSRALLVNKYELIIFSLYMNIHFISQSSSPYEIQSSMKLNSSLCVLCGDSGKSRTAVFKDSLVSRACVFKPLLLGTRQVHLHTAVLLPPHTPHQMMLPLWLVHICVKTVHNFNQYYGGMFFCFHVV